MSSFKYKDIDYKNTLKIFVKSHFPHSTIDDNSIKLLSGFLNDVNKQLVAGLEKAYKAEPKIYENTFYESAKKAIQNIFDGRTVDHALSEAFKQLALLKSGCMIYEDDFSASILLKKPITGKAREQVNHKRNQIFLSFFKSGVIKLSSFHLPNILLDKDVGHLLGLRIYSFAKLAAKTSAETYSNKDELLPVDIKRELSKYLINDALKMANAEANKYLVLFANGFLKFKARREHKLKSRLSQDTVVSEKFFASVFKPSIREMAKRVNPDLVVDSRVPKYLSYILMDLARYLAQNASEICVRKKAIKMDSEDLNQSTRSTFPKQLRLHALLNAFEKVRQYQRGLFSYDRKPDEPKISKTKATKRKISDKSEIAKKRIRYVSTRKRKVMNVKKSRTNKSNSLSSGTKPQTVIPPRFNFSQAITDILPDVFENAHASLAKNSRNHLCNILENTCASLIFVTIPAAGSAELGVKNINAALLQLFPTSLKELADAFGCIVVEAWKDSETNIP